MTAPIRIGDLLRDKGYIGDEHIHDCVEKLSAAAASFPGEKAR